jgi:hypothetical protein
MWVWPCKATMVVRENAILVVQVAIVMKAPAA